MAWRGVLREFGDVLPLTDRTPLISLNEGDTPLIEAPGLARWLGGGLKVFLKFEGLNPTGSFKDRGMVLAVAKAVEEGAETVICASTGNTSASAAAYAARAGLNCVVLVPHGKVALGKLAQAVMYGARVLAVEGNFDQALAIVREISVRRRNIALVNSVNPYRLEGQKTAAYEVCRDLGDAPDFLAIPVGNAGNISAYWQGFKECRQRGLARRLPRLLGFQAAGAAPLVHGRPVDRPESVATAIRIGRPASWQGAVRARDESGGLFEAVADEVRAAGRRAASRAWTRATSPCAVSRRSPVGSPVRGSRTIWPPGGSGVVRVIPARSSASAFANAACPLA